MMKLERAVIPEEQIDRAIEDIGKAYDKHPDHTCVLCGVPKGTTRATVLKVARVKALEEYNLSVVWINDVYQVHCREIDGKPPLVHLSIRRLDRQPCRDWRDMQQIKNQLVGPECEGVELYPAESRLVDTANQFHLWVFKDDKFRLPFGFDGGRAVMPPTEGTQSKQRA